MPAKLTASVKVYQACRCPTCENPKSRWFMCPTIGQRFVMSYECSPADPDDPGIPHPKMVAGIKADHPGCDLVYLGA